MQPRPIVDPRMTGKLGGFYPSVATIEQATETRDSFGSPVLAWASVEGLSGIPCRVAPLTIQTPTFSNEAKLELLTYLTTTHHVALQGYYPQIETTMRAVIDGVIWDIQGVEHDGQGSTTRLRVNRVEL